MVREQRKLDLRLREEFDLSESTSTLLPSRDVGMFMVRLPKMTVRQARAVLRAAREAGVELERRVTR